MELIQIILLVFSIFALSRVFLNTKNRSFSPLEGLFWTIFWLTAMIAITLPELITFVSQIFGVERGADLMIYFAIILLAYLIFRLYVMIHQQNKIITKLVRTIAIKDQ